MCMTIVPLIFKCPPESLSNAFVWNIPLKLAANIIGTFLRLRGHLASHPLITATADPQVLFVNNPHNVEPGIKFEKLHHSGFESGCIYRLGGNSMSAQKDL